jgi:hypothetical protein
MKSLTSFLSKKSNKAHTIYKNWSVLFLLSAPPKTQNEARADSSPDPSSARTKSKILAEFQKQ